MPGPRLGLKSEPLPLRKSCSTAHGAQVIKPLDYMGRSKKAHCHGTILSLLGVISGACMRYMFAETSLAVVYFYFYWYTLYKHCCRDADSCNTVILSAASRDVIKQCTHALASDSRRPFAVQSQSIRNCEVQSVSVPDWVSASSSLQCFGTVGWPTSRTSSL